MSYVRFNDQADDGWVGQFCELLSAEVRVQIGEEFPIFQDRKDIAWGQNWERRINEALDSVPQLLAIMTPGFFRSSACRAEVARFVEYERQLGRDDLILPLYYVSTPLLDDPEQGDDDEIVRVLRSRQFADWRKMRFEPLTSPKARRAVAQLAARMRDTFWRSPAQPAKPRTGLAGAGRPVVDEIIDDRGVAAEIVHEAARQAAQMASDKASNKDRKSEAASNVLVLSAFVSYSHKDERYRQALDTSVAQLKRNGLISVWYDRKILPGRQWDKEIDRNLETADIVLVLVSPDLLASDYAYTREMQKAIERHHAGLTTVIPVILRPSDWQHSPLGDLQALPSNGRPISVWSKRDQAWLNVVDGLRQLISNRG